MGHRFVVDGLDADVGAVVFEPVVGDGSEGVCAFAAEVLTREGDVGPAVVGEAYLAGETTFFEGG